jgi:hypothetical protein
MKIPNFEDMQVVTKDGFLTSEWRQILMQLFTELQKNASDEGLIAPSQPTANINQFTGIDKNGAIFYDSDTNQLKVNLNGVIKIVTVT